MGARPDAESLEPTGSCHADRVDGLDHGAGRTNPELGVEGIEGSRRSFGDEHDAAVGCVRDPADESELHGLAHDEVAEPDALDPTPNGRFETLECVPID